MLNAAQQAEARRLAFSGWTVEVRSVVAEMIRRQRFSPKERLRLADFVGDLPATNTPRMADNHRNALLMDIGMVCACIDGQTMLARLLRLQRECLRLLRAPWDCNGCGVPSFGNPAACGACGSRRPSPMLANWQSVIQVAQEAEHLAHHRAHMRTAMDLIAEPVSPVWNRHLAQSVMATLGDARQGGARV